jgi:transglutaminase-like putative cysteine protease
MIYEVRHVTTYRYEAPVASSRCALRLLPRSDAGQIVHDCGLDIAPAPAVRSELTDFFGNRTVHAQIETPHSELRVAALARIEVDRPEPPAAALTPAWEDIRRLSAAAQGLTSSSPVHGLFPSRLVPLFDPATVYARKSFTPGRPILEAASDLMTRIKADFRYDPTATAVSTPLAVAFDKKGGVCQDFAHIMIAGLRGLGLPAVYVSGYIRTIPPPGKPRLEGADASHAWVSVWCGAEFGWLDLDPTNALLIGNDHLVVAIGRDYADVSPVDGTLFGSGKQKLTVTVDVIPIKA